MKKFILGLVVGICITFPASLYAAENVQKIEAYLNPNVKIEMNGAPLVLEKTPIIYEQTTYLPLRWVAENVMGMNVGWEQETETVLMTSAIEEPQTLQTNSITETTNTIGGEEVEIEEQLRNLESQRNLLIDMKPFYESYIQGLKDQMEKNQDLDYTEKIAEYEQLIIDNDAEIDRLQQEIEQLKSQQTQPTP